MLFFGLYKKEQLFTEEIYKLMKEKKSFLYQPEDKVIILQDNLEPYIKAGIKSRKVYLFYFYSPDGDYTVFILENSRLNSPEMEKSIYVEKELLDKKYESFLWDIGNEKIDFTLKENKFYDGGINLGQAKVFLEKRNEYGQITVSRVIDFIYMVKNDAWSFHYANRTHITEEDRVELENWFITCG